MPSIAFAYDPVLDTGFTVDYTYAGVLALVHHVGAVATTLDTATVAAFAAGVFGISYNDVAGTITVTFNDVEVMNVSNLTSVYTLTGGWAGLLSDTPNIDVFDELCWTRLQIARVIIERNRVSFARGRS